MEIIDVISFFNFFGQNKKSLRVGSDFGVRRIIL